MSTRTAEPTLSDVAARAGVSPKTVSRVLNDEPNVRPEKIEKVLTAASQLGFRRNEMARLLRTRELAPLVGVVTGDVTDPFWAGVIGGVERSIGDDRFVVASPTGEDSSREASTVMAVLERWVTALVVVPTSNDQSYLRPAVDRGLPVVFADRPARGVDVDTVVASDRIGARDATELLIAAGHRRIAFLGRPTYYTTGERIRGYREALNRFNLPVDPALIFASIRTDEEIAAAIDAVRALPDPPTALFTANVSITIGSLEVAMNRKWTPGHVAFSEFDTSRVLSPAVTVVDNDPFELGQRAGELVLARLNRQVGEPQRIRLHAPVRIRASHLRFP